MRVVNGREFLVVCLSIFLPLCSVFSRREYEYMNMSELGSQENSVHERTRSAAEVGS